VKRLHSSAKQTNEILFDFDKKKLDNRFVLIVNECYFSCLFIKKNKKKIEVLKIS